MKKFWQVVVYEYTRHVLRRRFLFSMFSVPLVMVISIGAAFLVNVTLTNSLPLGYVDQAGFLAHPVPPPPPSPPLRALQVLAFESEDQAHLALQSGKIQGYYVLEPGYLQTRGTRLVAGPDLNDSANNQFRLFLRANLLASQPPEIARRVMEGDELIIRSLDGTREMGQGDWVNILVPFFAGFAFMTAMFTTSGYLLQAVVEEKENRTMEVLVTSVSPLQLIAGKIIAMIGAGLTQLLAWVGMAGVVILIGGRYFPWLSALHIEPLLLVLLVATMLPSFVLTSALMTAIGATVTEAREGQQITGLFTIPVFLPFWLVYPIMTQPNGPLAVALSLFPLTAPVTLLIRVAFAQIPAWQIGLSLTLLVLSALGAIWLAGRAFRLGMLQYGQRLSFRQLFPRVRREVGGA